MDSFLMMGQSNMAGRGPVSTVPPIADEGLFMLRCGLWQPLSEPVNPDRRVVPQGDGKYGSGVSPAAKFAQLYAEKYGRPTGLIPCAYGGSSLSQWQEGQPLFDHALMQASLAMRSSSLKAILWHQGESDSRSMEDVEAYESRFEAMLAAFTSALGMPDIPIILGELGSFCTGEFPYAMELNVVLHRIADGHSRRRIASAASLTGLDDGMHFDAASCRTLGARYFRAFETLEEHG